MLMVDSSPTSQPLPAGRKTVSPKYTVSNSIHSSRSRSMSSEASTERTAKRPWPAHDEYDRQLSPLLTDWYQITMAYAYWKSGRHNLEATFDLFYRQPPFNGSFIVFAGLSDCVRFLSSFRFDKDEIDYISSLLPGAEQEFLAWLGSVDCSTVRISAQKEGSIAFPRVPLMKVTGPLAVVQLLETTLLNLINFASLVTTNAYRFRNAAGPKALLVEFGLRRAQGPNGGLSASKYCYLGGFDGTSNVAAGFEFGIPVRGTHAHSFVQSFESMRDLRCTDVKIALPNGGEVSAETFTNRVLEVRRQLSLESKTSEGELASFITYAIVYPSSFAALVDTYSTLCSGVPNFMCVALTLSEYGFSPIGIRLDSGDLGDLSVKAHDLFHVIAAEYGSRCRPRGNHWLKMVERLSIMASNDVTLQLLQDLNAREHRIKAFGIGTHLVTCREQPALGCVYKLSAVADSARMKHSEEVEKASLPGEKAAFRLYDENVMACYDVLLLRDEEPPAAEETRTFKSIRRPHHDVVVTPKRVETLLFEVWNGRELIEFDSHFPYLQRARGVLKRHATAIRESLQFSKETSYEVLVSQSLFRLIEQIRSDAYKFGNDAERK